jgi:hypothetical protein
MQLTQKERMVTLSQTPVTSVNMTPHITNLFGCQGPVAAQGTMTHCLSVLMLEVLRHPEVQLHQEAVYQFKASLP